MTNITQSPAGSEEAVRFAQLVGSEIALLLHIRKRTRLELAALLGVSPQTITRRLNGDIPLDLDEVAKVAAWLNVPITRLTDPEQAITGRELP